MSPVQRNVRSRSSKSHRGKSSIGRFDITRRPVGAEIPKRKHGEKWRVKSLKVRWGGEVSIKELKHLSMV